MAEDTRDLDDYETIVAELVEELRHYKSASSALDTALQTFQKVQARVEATGRMADGVASRASTILEHLERLDAPRLVADLDRTFEAHREVLQRQSDATAERFQSQHQEVIRQGQELIEQVRRANPIERLQAVEGELAELSGRLNSLSSDLSGRLNTVSSELPGTTASAIRTQLSRWVLVLCVLAGGNLLAVTLVIVLMLTRG